MVWWFIIQIMIVLGLFGFGMWTFGNVINAIANLWPLLTIGVIGLLGYAFLQWRREKEKSATELLKTLLSLKRKGG